MTTEASGADAPISRPNLIFSKAELEKLPLDQLLATRDFLYHSWRWPEALNDLLTPMWEDMIADVEADILARPLTSLHDFCLVIIALSNPRHHGKTDCWD
ncbi:MAG: hypothetical protein HZT43_08205 [Exiguobacterium profundum]|nr:MAG: hypothetical protein HZT43_08205 [Exiguobacterium profundum]